MISQILFALLPLVGDASASLTAHYARSNGNSSLDWGDCETHVSAVAAKIGIDTITCANMSVPLDYTSSNNKTHILEVIKVPAQSGPSMGNLIVNFGGPGADGLINLAISATKLANITAGKYDLISFNPRGTSSYFMRFSCFNSEVERLIATRPNPLFQFPDAYENAADRLWAEGKTVADVCAEKRKDIGQYIGTAFTARDVLRISDALGDPLVNYYGMSYGSILGATLVAMFPERMDRVILDGVLNPHGYYHSFMDDEMVSSVDQGFRGLLEACVKVGPACPLARENLTADALEESIYDLFETLKTDSIPLPADMVDWTAIMAGHILDYSSLKNLILTTLYHAQGYSGIVTALDGILTGNITALTAVRDINSQTFSTSMQAEAFMGIICGDKARRPESLEEMMPSIEAATESSAIGGNSIIHGMHAFQCAHWSLEAKERYMGDFTARTKNPVLIIGNTYDPVTPLVSAKNVSASFEGSVVLESHAYGHVSWAHPSKCVDKAIEDYFIVGKLPKEGTVCEPDMTLSEILAVAFDSPA